MHAIIASGLRKVYRVSHKRDGLWAAVRGLIRPEFREVVAVREVSFTIDRGEMVAFLGPNGAGKTTTLKLLSGLIYPTAGTAQVLGCIPWERSNQFKRRFSLVMGQKNQLWWDLPARESFRLHQEIYRIEPAEFQRRLDELTDLLEVRGLLRQAVRELSLGERMRMELIAALLHRPELLLLDEPTIGLDVVSQRKVQGFLKHYQAEQQMTVVLTSHYMKDVEALCRRAIVINHGELMHDGPLSDLLEQFSRHKIVTVQFSESTIPDNLEEFGRVIEVSPPRVQLAVPRTQVSETLSRLLSGYGIEDLAVSERPLDEVIAEVFQSQSAQTALRNSTAAELASPSAGQPLSAASDRGST